MSNILLDNVSKSFANEKIISNCSMEIPEHSVTCIMGPSGVGKTTLLKMISGIYDCDSGQILNVPKKIGFVFQDDRLCESFSAVSNIKLVTGKKISEDEIKEHLTELGLGDSLNKPLSEYSGGMKRRVAIARAVCYSPELLILDEPFKGLDSELKSDVIDYIKKHSKNTTVIFVTHDEGDMDKMGVDTIIYL